MLTATTILVRGVIIVSSTAGSLRLQWAQNASDADATTVYAGSYLSARGMGARLRELGSAVDAYATCAASTVRIVAATKAAFRVQHAWYDRAVPRRQHVA